MTMTNIPAILPLDLSPAAIQLLNYESEDRLRVQAASASAPITYRAANLVNIPTKLDYSENIKYVRHQGAYACGMNAIAACWDIMNERSTAYCPNMSVNRQIWAWEICLKKDQIVKLLQGINHSPNSVPGNAWQSSLHVASAQEFLNCLHTDYGTKYSSVEDYLMNYGCPTEGTELTDSDAVRWPTLEGNYEVSNYRIKALPRPISVDINEFKTKLKDGPLRVAIWNNHYVALVGYDDTSQRFKFVNSWGDQWGDHGFGYVNYANLKKEIQGAQQYTFIPPKSVPSARVSFSHSRRQNVSLWIGIEGKASAKQIWPTG
jgi:hypothetical protein